MQVSLVDCKSNNVNSSSSSSSNSNDSKVNDCLCSALLCRNDPRGSCCCPRWRVDVVGIGWIGPFPTCRSGVSSRLSGSDVSLERTGPDGCKRQPSSLHHPPDTAECASEDSGSMFALPSTSKSAYSRIAYRPRNGLISRRRINANDLASNVISFRLLALRRGCKSITSLEHDAYLTIVIQQLCSTELARASTSVNKLFVSARSVNSTRG
jgi:hypothetical protein